MSDDGKPQDGEAKVVDIANGKKGKRKKADAAAPVADPLAAPPSKALLYRSVGLAIDRSEYSLLPAFPRRFAVVEPEPGVRLPIEIDDAGVCRYVAIRHVRNTILQYVTITCGGRPGFAWEARHAQDCAEQWSALARPVPEPPAVRWQDEEGLCFNRLPWRYAPDFEGTATPTFNELFGRISNAAALVEWIGSLFEPNADRQQYVWLYGHGGDGKGALVRFLKRILGIAFASKQPPARDEIHWTAGLLGKRLVVFPDANAAAFPASGLFKSLTGGDPVDINPKHKDPFTAELACKFLFLSNTRPTISSEKADMRRAIYCEFRGAPAAIDPDFERKLWDEGGAFLSTCVNNYRATYPKHGQIRTETDELADWVSQIEEEFQVVYERRLEAVPVVDGEGPRQYALPGQMQELLKEAGFDRRRGLEFLAWLERTHGVRKRAVKIDGESRKVYVGVRWKTAFE